jgi:microcin C transport system substrate-binding protein
LRHFVHRLAAAVFAVGALSAPLAAQEKAGGTPALPDIAAVAPAVGVAMHGEPQYAKGFTHFSYVNPDAPKGGEMKLYTTGTWDSFNAFIAKGTPVAGIGTIYDTLLTSAADEPFSEYGLAAETVRMPEDRSWVSFDLNPKARFHDGEPITPEDVIWTFNFLVENGDPLYRFYYGNVREVVKTGDRQVTFLLDDDAENRELPLILGQLPILPEHYWTAEGRDPTASTLEAPLGSGPYRIADFEPGRYVVYERVEDYWGKDLPVNVGRYNADRLRYDYYRDTTVALEAFKAGAYDVRVENSAKNWAVGYDFPAHAQGLVKKATFDHDMPSGMQGWVYNTRRDIFEDPLVREALAYAFNFEWANQTIFYDQYVRTRSYFDNSELAATGLPTPEELKILEPLRGQIPERVFTESYAPPVGDASGTIRDNLRTAFTLLQQAGWQIDPKTRKMAHADTGKPLSFEILLVSPEAERYTLPFVENLKTLGVDARVRTVDTAQYINRLRSFDFDMTVVVWGQSLSPGNEQREFWSSAAADHNGSRNYAGLRSEAVDALIEQVIQAPDRDSLVTRVHALDRVLQWNFLVIPHFHSPNQRIAYWDKFGFTDARPMRGIDLMSWWVVPHKDKVVAEGKEDAAEAQAEAGKPTGPESGD